MAHTIRPADSNDVQAITALIRYSYAGVARRFGLTAENCPKHPSNCETHWIARAMEQGAEFFLMEEDASLVGCVGLERADDRVCYMERLAVSPEDQNCGRGEALARHAMDHALKTGVRRVEIGIIAAQEELAQWYAKLGFTPIRTARFDHLPFEVAFMGIDL